MPLRLYNTFSKKEETFASREPGIVRMYTCGPTVYGRPHIGNYASFLTADLLRRWLEVSGYTVLHVKNITDVGHLVRDADRGDDKVEIQAKKEKKDPLEVARKYEAEYLEDELALNILQEYVARPRATETIPEMLAIIRTLLANSNAYETEDGIYYSVQSFPGYGKLSGNTLDKLGKLQPAGPLGSTRGKLRPSEGREGVRETLELSETKKHPADFALWKKCVGENQDHILRWSFETGERVHGVGEDPAAGFPGWHIECSAMSSKYLGPELDIHTGGEDNIFPHHECEIAQSEAAFGKTFVRYWLHKRRVNFGAPSAGSGQAPKMSKSLGNILTLPDIVKKGFHA
ncbi:MAG: class I tRNA ligase family protein, partial [Patescibacteria group bacterium]